MSIWEGRIFVIAVCLFALTMVSLFVVILMFGYLASSRSFKVLVSLYEKSKASEYDDHDEIDETFRPLITISFFQHIATCIATSEIALLLIAGVGRATDVLLSDLESWSPYALDARVEGILRCPHDD